MQFVLRTMTRFLRMGYYVVTKNKPRLLRRGRYYTVACKIYTSVFSTSFMLRTASADALNLACSALSSL